MRQPLLVVGAARSGTTLVAQRLLGAHPDVHYWSEPAFVWRYGNAYRLHDMLGADDARPHVAARIRSAFESKVAERPDALLVEKTPANCLRMPFVLSVLPDARILHVVRDGRQVVRSAREEWAGRGGGALDSSQIRGLERRRRLAALVRRDIRWGERLLGPLSILELPAYLPRILGFLARQVFQSDVFPWGPRFPGIVRARWELGVLGAAALQWQLCVLLTRSVCSALGSARYREVAFERLQAQPEATLREIQSFAGLADGDDWLGKSLELLQPRSAHPATGLTAEEVAYVESIIGATLNELGYPMGGVP